MDSDVDGSWRVEGTQRLARLFFIGRIFYCSVIGACTLFLWLNDATFSWDTLFSAVIGMCIAGLWFERVLHKGNLIMLAMIEDMRELEKRANANSKPPVV